MRVLAVGMPKTGTKSMFAALSILGYKVYDFEHNFYYLRKAWKKVFTEGGTKEDFYQMFRNVDACVDCPANVFWEEILEAFPAMKMIFTKRATEDEWYESFDRQNQTINKNILLKILVLLSPTAHAIRKYGDMLGRIVMSAPPQRRCEAFMNISPTVAKKRYRDHNTSVLQRAPKRQLLEFDLSDGWGPLCDFLGKEIPDIPFPHRNKKSSIVKEYLKDNPVFVQMKFEMAIIFCILLVIILAVAAFLL